MTKITVFLEYGQCNGFMNLTINGQNVTTDTHEINLKLPDKLVFSLSGKNYNHDTIVNTQGSIVSDKYIKLVALHIGGIPVEEVNLFKICHYQTDQGTTLINPYWGFNGTVTIDINQENFVKYLLLLNNKFDLAYS